DMKYQQIGDYLACESERARDLGRRRERMAVTCERDVRRNIAAVQRARHGVDQLLADAKVLEKSSGRYLGHGGRPYPGTADSNKRLAAFVRGGVLPWPCASRAGFTRPVATNT